MTSYKDFMKSFNFLFCKANEQTEMPLIVPHVLKISTAFCFKGAEFWLTMLMHGF